MLPKLLITGASGFIGSHLCHELKTLGIPFETLSRHDPRWPNHLSEMDLTPFAAVIHLACPRIRQADSWARIEHDTLVPLTGILSAIQKSQPNCHLVYLSSQSAKEFTQSKYGTIKWKSEQIIEHSKCHYTTIRPGLVVGEGSGGLFVKMQEIVKKFPIVPLIGFGQQLIQPVSVKSVVEAMIQVALNPSKHDQMTYPLAHAPVTFKSFLQRMAKKQHRRRLFVPVPVLLVQMGLWILEKVFRDPPVTRTSLAGVLELEVMDSESSWNKLEITRRE